jgi:predicted ATPase
LLAAQNISSFSELGFACGTPNRAPTDEEFKALSDTVLGGGATAGQSSLLRRLHFESATLVLSHLKTAVNSETIDGIRKLPFAEKQARYAKVKTTIQGFLIQGETEPSHALVDKCQVMFDTNSVVWLAPFSLHKA